MLNIAVLVSGGGTNLQAMLDAKARGEIPNGRFACVVASNPKAYALERAKNAGVETEVRSFCRKPWRCKTATRLRSCKSG